MQGLFEDGALVRNGTLKITCSLSQLQLPPTVQGILAARVDRLPRPQKDLLQTLAVIGREARLRLVQQVTSADEVLLSKIWRICVPLTSFMNPPFQVTLSSSSSTR